MGLKLNQRWHELTGPEVILNLNTDETVGLSSIEVARRLKLYGKNKLKKADEEGILNIILRQLANPLSLVLFIAAILTLLLGSVHDFLVILAALLINIIVGFWQEYRAGLAFSKLSAVVKRKTVALRDGQKKTVQIEELVVGDMVLLSAGDFVPADCRVLEENNLAANESVLTGEWDEVPKTSRVLGGKHQLFELANMLFMGTVVGDGTATAVVTATGPETEFGKIARTLNFAAESTPFQTSVKRLTQFLVLFISVILASLLLIGIWRGESLVDLLLMSAALAVSAIPEGLPIAVTVVLAVGMERILRRGGLVRNLLAAETLGSTSLIFTDKTGTLTEARMAVKEIVSLEKIKGAVEADGEKVFDEIVKIAVLVSDAFIEEIGDGRMEVRGRPIERAIVSEGIRRNLTRGLLEKNYQLISFLPFSSTKRYSAAVFQTKDEHFIYLVGAPELLINNSSAVLMTSGVESFGQGDKELLLASQHKLASEGLRLIAVAFKSVVVTDHRLKLKHEDDLPDRLTFAGLLVLHDPIRVGVKEAIALVAGAGVRTVMVTGDQLPTAWTVARELNIATGEKNVLEGHTLEKLSDEELIDILPKISVFARIMPHQKLRLVEAAQEAGEVVAMTGDGVNDAPALRKANIGLALGSGTEVAKEAADIVLINDSFEIISAAIAEGRRILDNLKKIVAFLLSTGFTEVVLVTIVSGLGLAVPLLPVQIIWANVIGEGLMNFAFVFEPAEADVMKRDPKSRQGRELLTRELKTLIILMTVITSSLVLFLYSLLVHLDASIEKIRTIMFLAISIGSLFFAFSLKNFRLPLWRIKIFSNQYLVWALLASIIILSATFLLEPLRNLLHLTTLSFPEFAAMIGFGLVNLCLIELAKFAIFKWDGVR